MSFASSGQKKEERVWLPKGKPSPFHDGPRNDQLFAMVMALTVEVAILRDRLDTHERVSEKKGGFSSTLSPLDHLTKQMLLEFDRSDDLCENLISVLEIEINNFGKSSKIN